jgi:hypothetical protein
VDDLKQPSKSIHHSHFKAKLYDAKETYDASIPNFGRALFPTRRGGRLLKGIAGIALSSSSPEVRWASSRSSESSTTSAISHFFGALGGDGAAEVDPSGTSVKSRPRYSPISGWGG